MDPTPRLPRDYRLVADISAAIKNRSKARFGPAATGIPSVFAGTEAKVADIWREYLGPVEIDRKSNFYALGGNSLMAVRVMSEIERRLYAKAPLHVILTSDFGSLCAFLEAQPVSPHKQPIENAAALDSSIPIEKYLIEALEFLNEAFKTQYVHQLRIPIASSTKDSVLLDAMVRMESRHALLACTVTGNEGSRCLTQDADTSRRFASFSCAHVDAAALDKYVAENPLDLRAGIYHVAAARSGDGNGTALIRLSRVMFDLESIDVLLNHLRAALRREPDVKSQDAFLRQVVDPSTYTVAETASSYWRIKATQPADWILKLDGHGLRDPSCSTGARIVADLPLETSRDALRRAQRHRVSLATFILSAFLVVVARETGKRRLPVGLRTSKRVEHPLDQELGRFDGNAYAMVTADPDSLPAVIEAVKNELVETYIHRPPLERTIWEHVPRRPGAAALSLCYVHNEGGHKPSAAEDISDVGHDMTLSSYRDTDTGQIQLGIKYNHTAMDHDRAQDYLAKIAAVLESEQAALAPA